MSAGTPSSPAPMKKTVRLDERTARRETLDPRAENPFANFPT